MQFLETDKLFNDDIETVILKLFPRRGMNQKIRFDTINVEIDPNEPSIPRTQKESLEGIQREYHSGKNKVLFLSRISISRLSGKSLFSV